MPRKGGICSFKTYFPNLNPTYNPALVYVPQQERLEWAIVGVVGKIRVQDDGSCKVNGFCYPGNDGIATSSESGYFVLGRISEYQILVWFK